ncbi:hypothetical protein BH10BAC3_BH10BAC3_08410 [soil metagenome]
MQKADSCQVADNRISGLVERKGFFAGQMVDNTAELQNTRTVRGSSFAPGLPVKYLKILLAQLSNRSRIRWTSLTIHTKF